MQHRLQGLGDRLAGTHGRVDGLVDAAAAARHEFEKAQSEGRKQLGHQNYGEAGKYFLLAGEAEKKKRKIESQLIEEAESDIEPVEHEFVTGRNYLRSVRQASVFASQN